jgi:3-oxoacyl-[acyl-carrier-protein] synthase III
MITMTRSFPAPRSLLLGTGGYVPEQVVTNGDLERLVETSDAWIQERTGIRERRKASDQEAASDMATAAARKALEMAGISASELSMIIVGTISADQPLPACAVHVQRNLGVTSIPAFDIAAACAGFLYGMSIADQFVARGQAKYVLVIGVELLTRLMNWNDRTTCVLFGDGAGAVVIGPNAEAKDRTARGILSTCLFSDGSQADALCIPAGGSREPLTTEGIEQRRNKVHMEGREIFKNAVRNLVSSSINALEQAGVSAGEITWVVAHQANLRILAQVAQRLEVPMDKFILNIERYGNTSSASIPLALDEGVRDGRIKPGDLLLMTALGAGLSWGSAVVRY